MQICGNLRELARPAPGLGAAPGPRAPGGWPGPSRSASRAPTSRPVRIMSSARLWPIRRGRRTVPPSISGTPQRRQNTPNFARLRGDAQVAPQRELEAAGDGVALDGGDHRLGEQMARRAHRPGPSGSCGRRCRRAPAADLEVVARAEGAAARRSGRRPIGSRRRRRRGRRRAAAPRSRGSTALRASAKRSIETIVTGPSFSTATFAMPSAPASCEAACRPAPSRPSGSSRRWWCAPARATDPSRSA